MHRRCTTCLFSHYKVWMKGKYETNWELENVSFSGIWVTSHWHTGFIKQTNLGSHSHKLSFTTFQSDLIQNVGNPKSSSVTPRWRRCECFAQSLVWTVAEMFPPGELQSKSFSKLHYRLSLFTKSFILGCWSEGLFRRRSIEIRKCPRQ